MNTSNIEKSTRTWDADAYRSFFCSRKSGATVTFCCDCLYYTGNREAGDEQCTGEERYGECSAFICRDGAPAFRVLWNRHACDMFSPLCDVRCKYEPEC